MTLIALFLFLPLTLGSVEVVYGSRRDNPLRKSTYLKKIAQHVNNNPHALWHSSPSLAGIDPHSFRLTRPQRRVLDSVDWRSSGLLRAVDNQGNCGSCWAFASTHAFDDYRSITAGRKQSGTSMQHVVSCCRFSGCFGCNGGQVSSGFYFQQQEGTVTESCRPYGIEDLLPRPICHETCANGNMISTSSKIRLLSFASVQNTEEKIREALQIGPLVTAMTVYQDFFTYKGGIYHHMTGDMAGGHLVEMVGYGSENGVDYWICKNSWGPVWGEQGYFRIRAGVQESDIEQVGGTLSPFEKTAQTTPAQPSAFLVGVSSAADITTEDIVEAAQFAAYELNPFCPERDSDRGNIGNLTLVSVHRAARKVTEGEQLNLIATFQEPGCPTMTSYEMTIGRNTDGEYSLIRSRYIPPDNVPGATSEAKQISMARALVFVLVTSVGILISC